VDHSTFHKLVSQNRGQDEPENSKTATGGGQKMLTDSTPTLDWREEFISTPRRPRFETKRKEIRSLLLRAMNVRVSLHQQRNYSEVVLKFPASVQQLPPEFQNIYQRSGVTLEDFFSEALFSRPPKSTSTIWSGLVRACYNAYRTAWLHLLKSLYLGHSHPATDKVIKEEVDRLLTQTLKTVGRRQSHKDEQRSIERRFRRLRKDCDAIHRVVQKCVEKKSSRQMIRKSVFQAIRGKRFDNDVLARDRNAWEIIPRGKRFKGSCLEDPTSWTPGQLSIALLAKERGFSYQTVQKKTVNVRNHEQYV
jgi:hypothetical protein